MIQWFVCILYRNASGYDNSKSLSRGKASFASQRYGSHFNDFTGKALRKDN